LTITKICEEEDSLSFGIGGGNIYFLVAREVVSANDYRVLDLTLFGIGSDEVTLRVNEDVTGKVIEFTYFEELNSSLANGPTSSVVFDFTTENFNTNLEDDSCGCDGPFLSSEETNVCIDISELTNPAVTANQNEDYTASLALTLD